MRNYAENGELCGIVRRTENCAISHSPHLNVASAINYQFLLYYRMQIAGPKPFRYIENFYNANNSSDRMEYKGDS